MTTIKYDDEVVMERTRNNGCIAYEARGINLTGMKDVICDYSGYKFYKSNKEYVATLTSIDASLKKEGREEIVSGSGCDALIACLVSQRTGEYFDVGRGYIGSFPEVELIAFHRNDTLDANNSPEYANLKSLLQNDEEFIYGFVLSDAYLNYSWYW